MGDIVQFPKISRPKALPVPDIGPVRWGRRRGWFVPYMEYLQDLHRKSQLLGEEWEVLAELQLERHDSRLSERLSHELDTVMRGRGIKICWEPVFTGAKVTP